MILLSQQLLGYFLIFFFSSDYLNAHSPLQIQETIRSMQFISDTLSFVNFISAILLGSNCLMYCKSLSLAIFPKALTEWLKLESILLPDLSFKLKGVFDSFLTLFAIDLKTCLDLCTYSWD